MPFHVSIGLPVFVVTVTSPGCTWLKNHFAGPTFKFVHPCEPFHNPIREAAQGAPWMNSPDGVIRTA